MKDKAECLMDPIFTMNGINQGDSILHMTKCRANGIYAIQLSNKIMLYDPQKGLKI